MVFHHYIGAAVEKGFAIVGLEGVAIGNVGVDIFFIISGFIMEYACSAKPYAAGDRKAFMINRMQRILPLYWILTILAFGAFLTLQGVVNSEMSVTQFVLSMLVLPDLGKGGVTYIIPMAWTLTYEFYFYVVFSLFLAAKPKTRLIGITSMFCVAIILGAVVPSPNPYLSFFTNPLIFEFLLGCALGNLYRSGIRLDSFTCIFMVIGALAVLSLNAKMGITDSWLRIVLWGGPAALLVYAAVLKAGQPVERNNSIVTASFEHIGNISYSLYLSHFFVLAVFVRLYAPLSERIYIGPWLAGASLFAACILVAHFCYILIENPSRTILKNWRRTQSKVVLAAGVS